MSITARLALLATPVLLAACTCCAAPAPSAPMPTPSQACVDAWMRSLASPSDTTTFEAPLRACRSLEELYAGAVAAHSGLDATDTKRFAERLCATGRFDTTAVCRQFSPPPPTPMPGQS